MTTESERLRIARYVNIGVWFWLLVSDVLNPVVTKGDFWEAKLAQAFSLNQDILNAPAMVGHAVLILLLWFVVDLLLRWLWSQGRGGQQVED
jgi:hypothetical protein